MTQINPQAQELNETIAASNPRVVDMLSQRGKGIFFPAKGILAQSADAKGKRINATIGMALEDDGSPLCLNSIAKLIDVEPAKAFLYAPSYGNPDLRDLWKEMMLSKNPSLSTAGAYFLTISASGAASYPIERTVSRSISSPGQ